MKHPKPCSVNVRHIIFRYVPSFSVVRNICYSLEVKKKRKKTLNMRKKVPPEQKIHHIYLIMTKSQQGIDWCKVRY